MSFLNRLRQPCLGSFLGPQLKRFASISPQASRIRRLLRKRVEHPLPQSQLKQCISASKCQSYNLQQVQEILLQHKIDNEVLESDEALYASLPQNIAKRDEGLKSDIFVLASGSVVGWNITEQKLISQVVPLFRDAEIESFRDIETEDMDYVEEESIDTQSGMVGDVIYVHGPTPESRLLDKLAFSSGMARNTKLSAIEEDTERIIRQVKNISSTMASGKSPHYNTKEVDVLTGRLLQLRGTLNLYSNITETPDLYWSQPQQESLYELISKSLDVEPRITILNNKLDYAADMVSILRQHLSERTSLRVEWMILILILIEVAIELKKTIPELLFPEKTSSS